MTERPNTPLRQRMIEDMTIRRLKPHTQGNYIRAVARLARHFNKSPDQIDYEEVRRYRLHLIDQGFKAHNINQMMTGLRFFYKHTLQRRDALEMIPLPPEPPRKLREILTREEVARLIDAVGPCRIRITRTQSLFAALAEAIVYQQLSGRAAKTAFRVNTGDPNSGDCRLPPRPIKIIAHSTA